MGGASLQGRAEADTRRLFGAPECGERRQREKKDGAKVVTTDIACSNGVIHVIDAVVLPRS